jgi:hypothetical protein
MKAGHDGNWNQNGFTSKNAFDNNHANPFSTGDGWAAFYKSFSAPLGAAPLGAPPPPNNTFLIRYTYLGDANLNGTVNTLDFTMLAANYNSTTQLWTAGDFNYDGVVNALDFNALATNFGQVLASPPLGSLVPEPQMLTLAALFAVIGRKRLRRDLKLPPRACANTPRASW